jgi:serine protease inhibitor
MALDGQDRDVEYGTHLKPEVKNIIRLSLAFAKAVGANQADKADNLVVSPYNAAACLSMVAKGAEGQTRDELAKALFGTDGEGIDTSVAAYAALNDKLLENNKGQVDIITANGVWTNKDLVELRDSFADDLKKTMAAEISAEDYADPATVDKINDWASKNTKGLINKVLESLSGDDAAVLASALYFKGQWTHKFDKSLTEDKNFAQDGAAAPAQTPTMHQDFAEEGAMNYLRGKDFEAVTLTYGEEKHDYETREFKNPTMRIVLVRPDDESVSARDWLASQANGKVPAWLDPWSYEGAVGSIELPHLDIKQKHDLIPPLQDMGVKQAFAAGAADFSRMVKAGGDHLYLSQVSHDVVFKTDEEGSEAAAVTVAVATLECVRAEPVQVDMKLDRSFVFALQDVKSGAVLFLGAVNKPNEEMKSPKQKASAPKP